MKNDKKNINSYINLILLSDLGKTIYYKTNERLLKNFFTQELNK